jgi:uncharacterized protein (TIGR02118 family)
MFKFVTLYRQVDDEIALDEFFSGTHLPLAERLPGLVRRELSRVRGKPGGPSRYYLMFELYFDSAADFYGALESPTGQQLMAALVDWDTAGLLTWFYADTYEEAVAAPT